MRKLQGLIVIAIILMVASAAQAVTINGDGLQNILNDRTQGSSTVNAQGSSSSAIGNDSTWKQTASNGTFEVLMINTGSYSFGIYDSTNRNNYEQIFSSTDLIGSSMVFEILEDGTVRKNFASTGTSFASVTFGFYLERGGTFIYSSDVAIDHMVAFQGTGDMFKPSASRPYGTWTSSEYILAWDWSGDSGLGANFIDYLVMIESLEPYAVPEPSSVLLLGGGLIGLGFAGYRRLQNKQQ